MFVIAIILGVIALVLLIATIIAPSKTDYDTPVKAILGGITAVVVVLAVFFTILSTFFTQDPGQSSILRDWTGQVSEEPITGEGSHAKAPWQDPITFDIRNQRVVYTGGNSEGDNSGGSSDGPQITVQDANGVTSDIDISVTYSIAPESVSAIYRQYGSEENLRSKLIFNDIRSITRSVPGGFTTIELLTNRDDVQQKIADKLAAKWKADGIIVNDVALQEIRVPESVKVAYAAAQEAAINVQTEQGKLDSAKISAQQKVVQAQAEADANAILNASLSSAILQQRYLDTLAKLAEAGNLVVVPDGFNGLINVGR